MSESIAAIRARLVNQREHLLRTVADFDEKVDNIGREREKCRAEAAGISRAIDLLQENEPATPARPLRLNIAEAIVAALADSPGTRSAHEIGAIIGRKPSQVQPALARLLAGLRVIRLPDGRYAIPAAAAAE